MTKEKEKGKESESKLEKLKKAYSGLEKKHGLPSFKEMNKDFYIEKISDIELENFIREIRRVVGDKLANYMRFIENLLNPVNVPMFVFSIVKTLEESQKKMLSDAYKKLVKNEIDFILCDLDFNEGKEAEFIKDSFEMWQEIKRDLLDIIGKVDTKWNSKVDISLNNRGYFS